jgi:hypothetical protein
MLGKMGYYDYQQGLIVNRLNQNRGWDEHLLKCREFIMKSVDIVKPSRITILGSGWLMEVPLIEIAEKAESILLIDILHPPEVYSQTAGLGNVGILEQDLSGGLVKEVWKKAGKRTWFNRLPTLGDIIVPDYIPERDPGLVISVNLITQLETLPERLLRRKTKAREEEYEDFRRKVQEKHLEFLLRHQSVIITDQSEILSTQKSGSRERKTLYADLPEGRLRDEWIWDFDLIHAYSSRTSSRFRVVARLF